ncbi:DUF6624 domain-containing protein [Xanthomonas graminis]|uniref:Protein n=1 Tax=Xanthomonas graminis pv. phlei TaxID=487906 RepID=A0A0K3A5Q6_9XANT|nr:DUF6624 domain-containing protein [Xanthomonas translucens]UKE66067.1 hypothetical protein KM547_01535 [Xanthomonas translucens pv. phlei]UKE73688.1 hypothetical protein KFS85_01620 [Xanthomonas translucens pv. phleipratensis]CTP93168.1 protein [Xanthomonas translucens pv. phlei]
MSRIVAISTYFILGLGVQAASAYGAEVPVPALRDELLALKSSANHHPLNGEELGALKKALEGGVPSEGQVGCDVLNAMGPVILASGGDRALQRKVVDALYERVGDDIDPRGYAELADRLAVARGKKQTYGAIPELKDGVLGLPKGLDERTVNQHRDELGLAPVALDLRAANDLLAVGVPHDAVVAASGLCQHPAPITHPDLRQALDERYERDQSLREVWDNAATDGDSAEAKAVDAEDARNSKFVAAVLRDYGFPSKAMVGRKGVGEFYLLVQHSHSPELMQDALIQARPLMLRGELARHDYALMIDRLRMFQGKPQIYGSQLSEEDGKLEPYPIEDRAGLDRRREAMEMEPFDSYFRSMQSE